MVRLATADDAADVARLMIGFRNWWQREEPDDAAFEAGVGRLLSDPRGSGLGRALAEAALARARERGCARVELDVNAANPAALALYESLGFEGWSDPPGGRNLLMRRRL
jgi:mycothiol synthase